MNKWRSRRRGPRPPFFFRRSPPPWWPEGEAWPPTGWGHHPDWPALRRRFLWRVGALLLLLFGFACGGLTLSAWLVTYVQGESRMAPAALPAGLIAAVALGLILVGLFWAGHSFRRLAAPIGDLIEAAGRVAEGDYSVRVEEYGPREVRALAHAFNAMAGRLQVNDEQRRHLLAEVTHDLRTPLTIIQGQLEGLLDGVYPRDEAYLNAILDETHLLSRLIDDLRTLALAEGGALPLRREPADLASLAGEAVAAFQPQAEQTGVTLALEISPDLPELELDPVRIREVLTNLMANALRYTPPEGKVCLRCERHDGEVVVSVSDTGAGIPPADLPHIFDRFYKSPDSHGAGLGLAIARNLVTAHGGHISASSEPGQGTTIRFTLPLSAGYR